MVISHTAKVGVAAINYKLLRLHTKIEVFCRRLIESGVMATSLSRVQVASVKARYSARIGTAMRHVIAQLRHAGGHQRAIPVLPDRRRSRIRVTYAPNWCAQLLHRDRHRRVRVCTALLQLTQLPCRDQVTQSARPIAAGQRTART